MNNYRKMMARIHAPKGLEARVLAADGERPGKKRRYGQMVLRRAVCAACVLALMLGSFSLKWENDLTGDSSGSGGGSVSGNLVLSYEFGLLASAAELGVNGGVILLWEDNCGSFRITGEDLVAVRLETSKGILMRNGEACGSAISEPFDASTVYAITPEQGGLLDTLDGVELSVTAIFVDGSEKSEVYCLTAEKLRAFTNEDGQEVLVPALEGDPNEKSAALYAAGKSSRWLLWPVAGSNTVSLSREFGGCMRVAGGGTIFHAGIDIHGESGSEITSAAAGTVIEAGFDPERGNYLLLDHGDGLTTLYGQCQELLVSKGDRVEERAAIALLGSTGMSTGPHLHFEVRQDGEAQNPVAYFSSQIRGTLQAK